MRRPIVWMALPVCFFCAAVSVLHLHLFVLLLLTVIIFGIIMLSARSRTEGKNFLTFLFIFSIISLLIISYNSRTFTIDGAVIDDKTAVQADVSGRVKKLNIYDDRMYLYLSGVEVETDHDRIHLPGVLLKCPYDEVRLGDRVFAHGTLKGFLPAQNEGNFDTADYYESVGIHAQLSTYEDISYKRPSFVLFSLTGVLQEYFRKSLMISSPEHYGELASIVIGDKSELDDEIKSLYSENGIAHLLAISGLHVSFAGLAVYRALKKYGAGPLLSAALSGACVITYTMMTGSGVSAWRACVMFIFAVIADLLGRSYDSLSALSVQAIVTLLITPQAIKGASFIMSYTAVIAIILCGEAFGGVLYRLKGSLTVVRVLLSDFLVAASVFFFMLPVNLFFYHSVPVYSVFLNMIVLPLSGLLLPLGLGCGLFGGIIPAAGVFFSGAAGAILDIYKRACEIFLCLPFNRVTPGVPGIAAVVLFYAFFTFAYLVWRLRIERGLKIMVGRPETVVSDVFSYMKGMRMELSVCAGLCAACVVLCMLHKGSSFYISMISVGQGDCVLVSLADGRKLLFDGGSSDIQNVYENRIKTYLSAKGITHIDAIIVSHTDEDHVNGLARLLTLSDAKGENNGSITVGSLIMPDIDDDLRDEKFAELVGVAEAKGIPVSYAHEGMRIEDEAFTLSCLSPQQGEYGTDINALSAVYKLAVGELSLLFTGDMTQETESRLLAAGADVRANVLKVAHHGSNYSSSPEFLEAVSPEVGIISCGINNRYGHPGEETMKRLEEEGIATYVTKVSGQITIEKKGTGYRVRTYLK